ncbi:AraC family transcriptional regulator [Psychrobium sp. 1_MG-2023]|uniref:helix-turn-helix transcriptional regulator n=1 Tax=Psychrobium sp. 1_MG-2023 TaxID=3062624 RepID=UPI000C321029|nr:AraC family transcriptional regulator [Psychrobium sp. 1_MG-2023]MDP2562923.1 helix-turn-helix domain-containing protein [Psychrobium sp. 1_MG-2023]PKF54711.1 hypothetical protein CW748_15765 [Alteromonadales bacterium alter-6D02]
MATIGQYYLDVCSHAAKKQKVDTAKLMKQAGVSVTAWHERVLDRSMADYLNSLSYACDDAFLGFASPKVPPNFFQLLLNSCALASTVAEAIALMKTGFTLAGCKLELVIINDRCELQLEHSHLDPQHYLLEFLMVFLHRSLSFLANSAIALTRATISYKPVGYESEFNLLFRCHVDYEQSHDAIYFNKEVLQWPILQSVESILQAVEQFPLLILRYPQSNKQLDHQVYQVLNQAFVSSARMLSATEVANELSMSDATLRRKLAVFKVNFSQLKAEYRHEQALRLLKTTTHSIEEIAHTLGYSEARAFSRVFQQWTDQTPTQYRALI